MTAAIRITDDEAAILRAWLGGGRVQDIAKARRVEPAKVNAVLVELCDFNRGTARKLLADDRAAPVATFQQPAPAPPVAEPVAAAPEPLESWDVWRCPTCRWLGSVGHPQACAGQPVPVSLLVVPRVVDQ